MMHNLAAASQLLGISIPAIKKRIYEGKLKACKRKGYNNREVWFVELPLTSIDVLKQQWLDDLLTGRGFNRPYQPATLKSYREGYIALWKTAQAVPCLSKWNLDLLKQAFEKTAPKQYAKKMRMLDAYRSFSHWLIRQNVIEKTVLDGIRDIIPKRSTPARRNRLQEGQARELCDVLATRLFNGDANERRLGLLILLILTSGLRISEALSLKPCSLDFLRRQIVLIGKGNKPRISVLSAQVSVLMQQWLTQFHKEGATLFNNWTYNAARLALAKFRKKANLGFAVCFHGLRRTVATQWVHKGVPLTHVSKLLGHSSLKTTQLYVESDAQDAVNAVKNLVLYEL